MCEDEPSCVNEDLLYLKAYGDTSFGRPIIGTVENIKRFSRDDFINYRAKNYKTNEMIIGVCGNVKNEKIQDLANKYFSKHEIKNKQYTREKAKYIGGAEVKFKKDLEQIKFSLGFNGIVNNFKNITHENLEKKYAMKIGSMILGAGMSSRLFQEIREKRGLVYYIHTMTENYSDTSLFTVNAGFSPDKIHEFVPALKDELIKICREISDCELNRAINQLEASFLMQLEKSSIRVDKIVDDLMLYNKIIDKDEILNIVKNLTKKQIMNAMASLFSCKPTLAVYGNVDNEKTDCLLKEFGEKL